MHIALLGPVAPPSGGVQSHMESLARLLRAAGVRVSLIAITRSQPIVREGVFYPSGPVALLKTLFEIKADVVHLHVGGDFSTRLVLLTAAIAALPGIQSLLTFHSGGYPTSPKGLRASWRSPEAFALRRLDACIAVNLEIADLFRRFGVSRDRISVIAPYARIDRSRIASVLPDEMAEFVRAHSPLLLSVGMLEPEYSLELQIEAFESIGKQWPAAGLMLIGSGAMEAQLRERISKSPFVDRIRIQGNVDHSVALRAIELADVLLRTTQYDGDAVSVREALQLGTAVVASNTALRPPGVALMASLDAAELSRVCSTTLSEAREKSSAASAEAPIEDELNRVLALYQSLLADRGRSGAELRASN